MYQRPDFGVVTQLLDPSFVPCRDHSLCETALQTAPCHFSQGRTDAWRSAQKLALARTLLHKSSDGQPVPSAGQSYPTTFVTGMLSAVKPFSTATRIWNSAT